ncbi:MAG TPA: metallophosphoesterase [Polyangiaceae bacterium]|nr:metallophosphoesterase [Polyangiaceae bacterium]
MQSPNLPLATLGLERREILKLLSVGSVVSAAGLLGCAETSRLGPPAPAPAPIAPRPALTRDFSFLQLSDTHWGYEGPGNPEASHTLIDAVNTINASPLEPDFVVFTGDLTHTTDDPALRRSRLKEFERIVSDLKVKNRFYLPGEHDAGPDGGAAFREVFGATYGAFEHEGIHFVRLDNVSANSSVGDEQLAWLASDLSRLSHATPLVLFTHRPLFKLFPSWDWSTRDGERVLDLVHGFDAVTVFYGHIHQEHHVTTAGGVKHHAARSLIFPLPAPGSVPKKAPLPWDPEARDHGLGYRTIAEAQGAATVTEMAFAPRTTPNNPPQSLDLIGPDRDKWRQIADLDR